MTFYEIQFPQEIGLNAKGGPAFSTTVVQSVSGFEQRNQNWATSRRKWDLSKGAFEEDEKDKFIAFFRLMCGKANGFRMRDWSDYSATAQNIGVGTGSLATFQLRKAYTVGGQTVYVNIKKPITASVLDSENVAQVSTVKIYKDGALQTTGYTVAHATGIVTFSSIPAAAAVITADFEYDIPARFDMDEFGVQILESGMYTIPQMQIVELKI